MQLHLLLFDLEKYIVCIMYVCYTYILCRYKAFWFPSLANSHLTENYIYKIIFFVSYKNVSVIYYSLKTSHDKEKMCLFPIELAELKYINKQRSYEILATF